MPGGSHQKQLWKEYIQENKGCYETDQVNQLPFKKDSITLKSLFDTLPIKDFNWFFVRKCELTLKEKRLFALHCAKQVLPIYEKHYPKDSRVRDCIKATEDFLKGNISEDELRLKRYAAAADAAAYAAAYAAAAADAAAAYAAAYAAAAADAADAAYAAAYAAYAAAAFKESIWEFIKTIK